MVDTLNIEIQIPINSTATTKLTGDILISKLKSESVNNVNIPSLKEFSSDSKYLWVKEWLDESGFIRAGDTGEEIIEEAYMFYIGSMFLLSGLKLSDENRVQFYIFTKYFILSGLTENILTKTNILGRNKTVMTQVTSIMKNVYEGLYETFDDLPDQYPVALKILKGLLLVTQEAKKVFHSNNFAKQMTPFIDASIESLQAFGILQSRNISLTFSEFEYLKKFQIGFQPFIELCAIVLKINLSTEIQGHIMIYRIKELASGIVALIHDIFELPAGLDSKEKNYNLIILQMSKSNLETSFEKALSQLNEKIVEFESVAKKLRETYDKNKVLEKFLSLIENLINGYFDWNIHKTKNDAKFKITTNENVIETKVKGQEEHKIVNDLSKTIEQIIL